MKRTGILILSLGLTLGGGAVIGMLTQNAQQNYVANNQPPFSPPGWIFPVMWTLLYLLMGIAAWLAAGRDLPGRGAALALYLVQLAFNFAWSPIYFLAGNRWAALVCLGVLWVLALLTLRAFARVSAPAAVLMVPYQLWLTFAFYLNLGTALLN